MVVMLSVMSATEASALNISSALGSGGYDVVSVTVATEGIVDMSFTGGGFTYASFSLFDAAGDHLITNEESNSSYFPKITQTLAPGAYSLLVTTCCYSGSLVLNQGGYLTNTDGFNYGYYFNSGNATLAGMAAYISVPNAHWEGNPYTLTITGAVPEPQAYVMYLAGLGLVGAIARRKKRVEIWKI